jgi:hypothetical protein
VPDYVGDQSVALGVIHDLAHQGASLTEVVVVFSLRIGSMDELSAGLPYLDLRIPRRIGLWSALGVWRANGLKRIIARIEVGAEGPDTRFIVTNLKVRNARVL